PAPWHASPKSGALRHESFPHRSCKRLFRSAMNVRFNACLGRRRFLHTAGTAFLLAGCGRQEGAAAGALRIGMDLSYPPFEMLDAAGQPDGVGVRLAEALAAYLGRPLKVVPMEFDGL